MPLWRRAIDPLVVFPSEVVRQLLGRPGSFNLDFIREGLCGGKTTPLLPQDPTED